MAADSKQSVVAGLFVLAGVLLAAATLVTIQQLTFDARNRYTVEFSVKEGVAGIAVGSQVQVGGLAKGVVTAVTPMIEGDRLKSIEVAIELDASITLFSDAKVLRVMPLLGQMGALNFTSLGGGSPGATRVAAGGTIAAMPSPGMLATLVGGDNAEQVGEVIDNVGKLSVLLGETVPNDYRTIVQPALRDLEGLAASASASWAGWSSDLTETLGNARTASVSLVDGLSEARGLVASAQRPIDDLTRLIESNTGRIDTIVENAVEVSEQVRTGVEELTTTSIPLLNELLARANGVVDDVGRMLTRLEPAIFEQIPQVRDLMANLRTSSAELKLAILEVRRNPWRLLFRPTSEVVAHENLFEASRTFAIAAADVKVAGQAFREILDADPDAFAADPELAAAIRSNLLEQMRRYEQAQQDLFRVISGER